MNKRLLPIGMQDFEAVRADGFVYVDKTARAHELITGSGRQFFLSRPRRFGKSLLCSTLGAIFEGKRELFQEIAGFGALAIDSLEWGWKAHPVIRLDLNIGDYSGGVDVLSAVLQNELGNTARQYGVELRGQLAPIQFANLIFDLHERFKERAVVIIDEYDKPLLATIDKPLVHAELRSALKGFYGVLKSSDAHLRLVFITGVTKFARVSIFSDLNQLNDLTFDAKYADLCGITQEEMENVFAPEIDAIASASGKDREAYIGELRNFYNGYRFSEKTLSVYNPFGLLNHFNKGGKFLPYWYESATPEFLIRLIKEQKIDIANLGDMRIGRESFGRYDVEDMKALPVLCQAGYLTISGYDAEDDEFALGYPNLEVRSSFAKSLLWQYLNAPETDTYALISALPKTLKGGDVDGTMEAVRRFLASVPYDLIKDTENYYQTAVHIIFSILGLKCRSEVRTADGRIDTLVETDKFVYCFEFKLNKSAESALAQIGTKEYLLPWSGSGKKLFKVGVNFSGETKNIAEWKCEADPV
jgi:hypothetical protein